MENISTYLEREPSLSFLSTLLKRYRRADVYLVGGLVRDLILGRPSKDYDFVVRGIPPAILEKFLRQHGRVNLVGKTFGVYKFQAKDSAASEPIDIALPRTEHSLSFSGGYRDFSVKPDYRLTIEHDLQRRDYTINALAWDMRHKKLVDPVGGSSDLASRTIRAVGVAEQRLSEDYSRILRGLRLAVQLNFTFEHKTWRAIKRMAGFLNSTKLPREAVARELGKALAADPLHALDVFELAGVFRVLIPEITHLRGCPQGPRHHAEGDVWTHTRLAVEALFSSQFRRQFPKARPDLELVITTLLHDVGKAYTFRRLPGGKFSYYGHELVGSRLAQDICERLRLSSYGGLVDGEQVGWLIRHHLLVLNTPPAQLKPMLIEKYFLSPDRGLKLLQLIWADRYASRTSDHQPSLGNFYDLIEVVEEIKKTGYTQKTHQPVRYLSGDEIIQALKSKPGPKIGRILARLRAAQLKKTIRSKKQALAFLERYYGKKNTASRARRRAAPRRISA